MLQEILIEIYYIFFSLSGCHDDDDAITETKIEVNYYDNTITDKTEKKITIWPAGAGIPYSDSGAKSIFKEDGSLARRDASIVNQNEINFLKSRTNEVVYKGEREEEMIFEIEYKDDLKRGETGSTKQWFGERRVELYKCLNLGDLTFNFSTKEYLLNGTSNSLYITKQNNYFITTPMQRGDYLREFNNRPYLSLLPPSKITSDDSNSTTFTLNRVDDIIGFYNEQNPITINFINYNTTIDSVQTNVTDILNLSGGFSDKIDRYWLDIVNRLTIRPQALEWTDKDGNEKPYINMFIINFDVGETTSGDINGSALKIMVLNTDGMIGEHEGKELKLNLVQGNIDTGIDSDIGFNPEEPLLAGKFYKWDTTALSNGIFFKIIRTNKEAFNELATEEENVSFDSDRLVFYTLEKTHII